MPFCPRRAAAAGCSVGRRAKLVFLTHPHCPLTLPPSPRFGLWPARRASELLCCSRLVRRSDRARAMYVTKNVSVVRVRECLDHPRKGERREEGRKEGRMAGRQEGEGILWTVHIPTAACCRFLACRQPPLGSRSPPWLQRRNEHEGRLPRRRRPGEEACEENGFAFVCRRRSAPHRTLTG